MPTLPTLLAEIFTQATLGDLLALGAAVSWAGAVILFKQSGATMPPMALNLFKNVVALVPLVATLYYLGELDYSFSPSIIALFFMGGVAGIGVADTLFFAALQRLGPSRSAIVNSLYSPVMASMAFLLLGEMITLTQIVGGALIISSITIVAANNRGVSAIPTRDLIIGIGFEMSQLLIMGLSVVPIKAELEAHPHIWAATVRLSGGAVSLAIICTVTPRFRKHWSVFRPQRAWRVSIPASLLGTYVAMACWLGGFKYGSVTRASLLNQTSTFFTVLFAWLFLKEPLNRLRIVALLLALSGAAVVILGRAD